MKVSVCMATYNGERYLDEQLRSILRQLGRDDEIIIVDDASLDSTPDIIASFADARIRLVRNRTNIGVNQSFARALSLAANDVVFMSDQDDVWVENRVERMRAELIRTGSLLVSSNQAFIDAAGDPTAYPADRVRADASVKHFRNILDIFAGRKHYYGCTMAFRRELTPLILPVPAFVESHDLWIALAANLARRNAHLEADTLRRRLHGENASIVTRPIGKKLWSRVIFVRSLIVLIARQTRLRRRTDD